MTPDNPGILSHASVGTNDLSTSRTFYDAVLTTLGCKVMLEYSTAVAYGRQFPEFWLHAPKDGRPATTGNGSHLGFIARSKQQVRAFYAAALANGGTDDGPPGPREGYTEAYYGCFVRDPDGHQIAATFWDE